MKFLNIILSIYLVALLCIPCADIEVNSVAYSTKEMDGNHKDHSHDKENDLCSPFCICNCCGAQIFNYFPSTNFEFPTIVSAIETKESFYKSTFTSNFFGSIWQPPQIA